jgi:hypothetical protein
VHVARVHDGAAKRGAGHHEGVDRVRALHLRDGLSREANDGVGKRFYVDGEANRFAKVRAARRTASAVIAVMSADTFPSCFSAASAFSLRFVSRSTETPIVSVAPARRERFGFMPVSVAELAAAFGDLTEIARR